MTKCSMCESGNVEPIIYNDIFRVRPDNTEIRVAGLEGYRCLDCGEITISVDQIHRNHERIQKNQTLNRGE